MTGTIALPTQNVGQRVEVRLTGTFSENVLKLSGEVEHAEESDEHRNRWPLRRRRCARRHDCRPWPFDSVDSRATERTQISRESQMFLGQRHLSRRAVLQGLGASRRPAVPRRDDSRRAPRARTTGLGKVRLSASRWFTARRAAPPSASKQNLWAPAAIGRDFDLSPSSLSPLDAVPAAPHHREQHRRERTPSPSTATEIGGRPLPVERHLPHPGAPEADPGFGRPRRHLAGPALRPARRRRDTDSLDAARASRTSIRPAAVAYGYVCVYTDTISWASHQPLPMIRDPRVAFDQLFGVGRLPRPSVPRQRNRTASSTGSPSSASRLNERTSAPPTAPGSPTTSTTSARSSDASRTSRLSIRAARSARCPKRPIGVPDSFTEHVRLMFDLQVAGLCLRRHPRLRLQDSARDDSSAPIPKAAHPATLPPDLPSPGQGRQASGISPRS